jgi:hypothetical protein
MLASSGRSSQTQKEFKSKMHINDDFTSRSQRYGMAMGINDSGERNSL